MKCDDRTLTPEALEMIACRFRLLADPLRLRILHLLGGGEMTVGELAAAAQAGHANVSKHLASLRDAGLVGRRRAGSKTYYRVVDSSIFELCDSVCDSLSARLAAQQRAFSRGERAERQIAS